MTFKVGEMVRLRPIEKGENIVGYASSRNSHSMAADTSLAGKGLCWIKIAEVTLDL